MIRDQSSKKKDGIILPKRYDAELWVTAAEWGQEHPDWIILRPVRAQFGWGIELVDPALASSQTGDGR